MSPGDTGLLARAATGQGLRPGVAAGDWPRPLSLVRRAPVIAARSPGPAKISVYPARSGPGRPGPWPR